MTIQQQIKTRLETLGIPYREVKVYGSQITVECSSRKSAEWFAVVVGQFAKVRGIVETTVDAVENRETNLLPTQVKVFRLYARM